MKEIRKQKMHETTQLIQVIQEKTEKSAFWMGLGLFFFTFLIYYPTLPPGITLEDAGLFISSALAGVPAHPPGYPFFMILLKVWIKTLSWFHMNQNPARLGALLSIFLSSGAAFFMTLSFRRWQKIVGASHQKWSLYFAGLGTLSIVLSFKVWEQSIIVEVYSLHLLFVSLFLWLLTYRKYFLTGLVIGLSFTNHSTSIFLPLFLLFWILFVDSKFLTTGVSYLRNFFKGLAGVLVGLIPFAFFFIGNQANAPILWDEYWTLSGFFKMISRYVYTGRKVLSFEDQWLQITHSVSMVRDQAGWIWVLLVITCVVLQSFEFKSFPFTRKKGFLLFSILCWLISVPFMAYLAQFPSTEDAFEAVSTYILPGYIFVTGIVVVTLPLVIGSLVQSKLDHIQISERKIFLTFFLFLSFILGWQGVQTFNSVDMSHYFQPLEYLESVRQLQQNKKSIFITFGDEFGMPLFYGKFVEGMDNTIVIDRKLMVNLPTVAHFGRANHLDVSPFIKSFDQYWRLQLNGDEEGAENVFQKTLSQAAENWISQGYQVFIQPRAFLPLAGTFTNSQLVPVGIFVQVLAQGSPLPPFHFYSSKFRNPEARFQVHDTQLKS